MPAIVERKCGKLDRDVLALPVRLGGLGLSNWCHEASREHAPSVQVTSRLVDHIVAQIHQLPDESLIKSGCQTTKCGKAEELSEIAENLKQIGPLHDPVTWHGINYTGTQITQWDFQNKGKSGWTGTSSFVLEVPLRNLRPSVIYSVPCDRIVQRAYCSTED